MVMSFKAGNHLRFAEALVAISINANAFAADSQVAPDIASTSGSGSATPSHLDNILRFNQMVQAFLQNQPATEYIDIYTAMIGPDQKPNPALFVQDQIHLSGLGYQMLRQDVSTFLSSKLHP
jgi:hypothetical protein